jgi:hypothetical protein
MATTGLVLGYPVVLIVMLWGISLVLPVYRSLSERNANRPKSPEEIQEELEMNGPPEFQQLKAAYANPLQGVEERTRNERLKALLTKFSVTKDEFDNRVTYRHKVFSQYYNENGTTLRAKIIDRTFYLDSAYVGEHWIFEKSFMVKVGDKEITASDDSPKHDTDDGVVDELIFVFDARAVAMANLIANANGEPVRVRLSGETHKDYTLREPYRSAITQTLELWKLLGGNSSTWLPHTWVKSE